MYKSDIANALEKLAPIDGGATKRLLEIIASVHVGVEAAIELVAQNNENSFRLGTKRLHEAIQPVIYLLSETSLYRMAVELESLGARFEDGMRDHPALTAFLSPGRQAVAELADAYDVALKHDRRAHKVLALVRPAANLRACYEHYSALADALRNSVSLPEEAEVVEFELAGAEHLADFSAYVAFLADLGDVARKVVHASAKVSATDESGLTLLSLDSGSPAKIQIFGSGKTIRVFLAMIKDVFKVVYRKLSKHGQLLETMETFEQMKKLGVDSPQVQETVELALIAAARQYNESVLRRVSTKVNGEIVSAPQAPALPTLGHSIEGGQNVSRALPPPERK